MDGWAGVVPCLYTLDSGSAPSNPIFIEEKETGTTIWRSYRNLLAPMYNIVPRYPSRTMMMGTCTKRQDIVG